MTACFIVRAQVDSVEDRAAFDRWYQEEHLPDALNAFRARRAWRGWSDDDPSVHLAFYEFDGLSGARAILDSEALKGLIAEFDRRWEGRVTRSREIVEILQVVTAS